MTTNHSSHHRVVLADVENLLGTANPSLQEVVEIRQDVLDLLGNIDGTHFEIACSHRAAAAVRFGFPEGRHQWRSGEDGADLALIDVLIHENVLGRFDEVVIASGDGIFAPWATRLARAGIRCTVICRRDSLSARLGLAAQTTMFLAEPTAGEGHQHAA